MAVSTIKNNVKTSFVNCLGVLKKMNDGNTAILVPISNPANYSYANLTSNFTIEGVQVYDISTVLATKVGAGGSMARFNTTVAWQDKFATTFARAMTITLTNN